VDTVTGGSIGEPWREIMQEYAVEPVQQPDDFCEAFSLTAEAEHLQEMTRLFFCEDADNEESDPDARDSMADAAVDVEATASGLDLGAAQVQSAARSVAEEAARLQADTEAYTAYLLAGAARARAGTVSAQPERAGEAGSDPVLLEALEVAKEAERLQHLVVRLLARLADLARRRETSDE
jgi:hypothetical protein